MKTLVTALIGTLKGELNVSIFSCLIPRRQEKKRKNKKIEKKHFFTIFSYFEQNKFKKHYLTFQHLDSLLTVRTHQRFFLFKNQAKKGSIWNKLDFKLYAFPRKKSFYTNIVKKGKCTLYIFFTFH